MKSTRTTASRTFAATLALAGALALGACSSDDEAAPPQATGGPDATSSLPPQEAPSSSPSVSEEPPVVDGGEGATIARDQVPAGAGWKMAEELDTNAPVDPSALGGKVTPSQVQEMRRAWNERRLGLDAASGSDNATPYCSSAGSDVWIAVARPEKGDPLVLLGVVTGEGQRCSVDGALLVVDSGDNEVLGDDSVALLL